MLAADPRFETRVVPLVEVDGEVVSRPRIGPHTRTGPGGTVSETKFSPTTPAWRRARREHLVDELPAGSVAANPSSNGITTSSCDPELRDQLGLGVEARQQLRRRLGPDHRERVRLERQHRVAARDHLAVAEVDAVELADRDPARPGSRVGEPGHLHRREA